MYLGSNPSGPSGHLPSRETTSERTAAAVRSEAVGDGAPALDDFVVQPHHPIRPARQAASAAALAKTPSPSQTGTRQGAV